MIIPSCDNIQHIKGVILRLSRGFVIIKTETYEVKSFNLSKEQFERLENSTGSRITIAVDGNLVIAVSVFF